MYLFTRQTVLSGDLAAGTEWAAKIGAHVTTVTGVDISTWATWFGAPLGTVTWSAWVESLDGLSVLAAVEADATYLDMVREGEAFGSAPQLMSLRSPLTPMPAERRTLPLGSVATITTAVAAAGKLGAAAVWGSEVSAHVSSVTGEPIAFFADAFGTFGQMTWIGVSVDAKAADAANDKVSADSGYLTMLDATGGMFVEGMSSRTLTVRIG
jgi:hypothetical protein